MFMHGGLLHLGGNMLFLWIFGNNVEDSMGPVKFIVFYLLAGIAATALQTAINPDSAVPNIGASGAVAGVLGGYLLLFPRARVVTVVFIIIFFTILELPAMLFLVIWFAQQALFGYFGLTDGAGEGGGVAYFAHIGGFVFGLLAIKLFASERAETAADRTGGRADVRIAVTAVALLFICAMAFATVYVLITEGPDVLSLIGVLVVALLALRRPRRALGAVRTEGAASADAVHAVPGRSEAAQAARARRSWRCCCWSSRRAPPWSYLAQREHAEPARGRARRRASARRCRTPAPCRWPAAGPRRRRSPCGSRSGGDTVRARFKKPPRAGLLFDIDTGRVLWRHDPTRVLPIASLTKMMTALVVADRRAARRRR